VGRTADPSLRCRLTWIPVYGNWDDPGGKWLVVARRVREEFLPLAIDPELAEALSASRIERERQGLSLSDVLERSGIDATTLSLLETGRVPNPAVNTLRAVARALHKRLAWSLIDEPTGACR
jgi:hypothetical protein